MHNRPIAAITGASSGIGTAIATRLAADGYNLALCARRRQRLAELADVLSVQHDVEVLTQAVDLRDEQQILSWFGAIATRFNRLDVLVNNAGLGYKESLTSGSTEKWRETMDVNVIALSICTREAVKLMRELRQDRGHIVHISSMSAHRVPGSGMYSASKFAVRALTEGLRQELRAANSAIRISSISPGFVETEFAEKYSGSREQARQVYSQFPVLQPNDIASAVGYVLSQPDYVQVHDILLRPTQQGS
ncbi:SDR family NAD(P)-dependent oxidoreductase [Leptolyngbya cf. ectocarpi LEGE 11479]|uniref:SDR family NAD(P)-dependent oxidoreductase n=1 Tax=Leptolyngbya cf. ectocarpi LEGE 11479 TaxID=1828722 RepID=A0A929A0C0_LEPEC|nr:SDR family NAD(P)-dependent oxidoreductase [Leptolyngbya ectocarpi]MBE9070829.1 SDR family NAD(P)-dependent oxidoreductase [Leptolyngbya cf. ectocarpi LEGE 11479]